ncbi:MAG: type IV pili methyl-accepting chemotaxis transducer N-terminal domain-containing protein, partial [Rubrivivax sp.]|nr:type IV pili methyl-accepting chemotaxis transducer N-terminal domain-containing protein [Rubrivivax sp.]
MNLLDRIKGNVRGKGYPQTAPSQLPDYDDLAPPTNAMEATVRLSPGAVAAAQGGRGMAPAVASGRTTAAAGRASIIAEASPSELTGEFHETRLPGDRTEAAKRLRLPSLPMIGAWPLEQQQRALIVLSIIGLVLLVGAVLVALVSGARVSSQVGAAGQAQMQSQRLAKSVSQALVGNATAFPEVRESVEVLTRNLRSLKSGEGDVPVLGGSLQGLLEPLMPLVDRAEKNAAIVLTQQKTLTQVGQALRAISRQSADLLETAETVSSLKLQQGASAGELSAVGQLVMLTQRIGKSANEFLTTEGVSSEAVFLLGKDLNSFKEIAQGVMNGSTDLRLPGTRDAQVRERLQQLIAQYDKVRV